MMKLNKKSIILVLLVFFSLSTYGQNYKGDVFVDLNNNGNLDKSDKPLKGVLVTDGINIVKTDESGRYILPKHAKARLLYISVPSGYMSDTFYYAIQQNKDTYDFKVHPYKYDTKAGFSFVQITDTETPEYGTWIDNLKDYIHDNRPAFLVHTGDICYDAGMKFHAKAINNKSMGGPVHYSIGNHDLVKGTYGEQLYESLFGPGFYSFDVANTHFIVLPMLQGDYTPSYTKEEVFQWMKKDLSFVAKGQKLVVFSHDLLTNVDDHILAKEGRFIYSTGKNEYIDLGQYHLLAWIYGHWHDDYIKKYKTGIISACGSTPDKGGIIHSLSSFRVFTISKEGKLSIETRYTYINRQAVVASPAQLQEVGADGNVSISVNAYHTSSPIESISYKMASDSKQDWSNTAKNEWQPLIQVTSWNWRGVFHPSKESIGKVNHMEVSIKLKNGSTYQTQKFFTVSQHQPVKLGIDWPQLLKDNALSGITIGDLKAPLQLMWTSNAGGPVYMCSPIVAAGKVFIATRDEGNFNQCFIVAFDALTGKRLWQYKTLTSVKGAIAYQNKSVVAADDDGNIYCINSIDGSLKWKTALGMIDIPAYVPGVIINNNKVFTGAGAYLAAIDLASGKILWQGGGWDRANGTTAAHTIAGDILVSSSQWNSLFGNDLQTGKLVWSQNTEGLRFRSSPAVYIKDKLYTCSENKIFSLDVATGKIEGIIKTPYNLEVSSRPLVLEDKIIVSTADAGIAAFDLNSGRPLWTFATAPALTYSSPYTQKRARTVEASLVLKGHSILFGAMDGKFYSVNADTGACEWSTELGSPILSSVAVSGGIVYVADYGGNVYAFKSKASN